MIMFIAAALLLLLAVVAIFASLLGIIYPFAPFRTRNRAAKTLAVSVAGGIFALFLPIMSLGWEGSEGKSGTVPSAPLVRNDVGEGKVDSSQAQSNFQHDDATISTQSDLEPEPFDYDEHLAETKSLIADGDWKAARTHIDALSAENLMLAPTDEADIEALALSIVRPLPASDTRGNLDGYQFLSALVPSDETYSAKTSKYRRALANRAGEGQSASTASDHVLQKNAHELVWGWGPKKVVVKEGNLAVVLPLARITPLIQNAVIAHGLCSHSFTEFNLDGLKSIVILNQTASQGFVYEKGVQDCASLMDAPSDELEWRIAAYTHWY
ncbi:hypothetical protein CLV78_1251 [Aliiruegeria haliotis]|uniref:Uncharacterized protein n=1 Tax=Aliiruegeria haliotis TaxID=1280846 RepID=A0A2T0RDP4_9RHOB|nr:hypothetical protein [Aliiruegeria haliotis]PRY19285.1 hypothetical protein CLV78_1251 [Aliiruegeria haliotis]